MLFKTFLAPKTILLPLVCSGGRSNYLGGAFPVYPCPEVESVVLIQKRCPNFPLSFQPFVAAGVARACSDGLLNGKRLCGVRLEVDLLKFHDVDTTEQGVERRAYYFVSGQLWEHADPIEPVPPEWRTPAVLALGEGYRQGGGNDSLPILADALEDAGCDMPLSLTHLRTCADHGERCWVVDLILGK
jgi:hypothetical protein